MLKTGVIDTTGVDQAAYELRLQLLAQRVPLDQLGGYGQRPGAFAMSERLLDNSRTRLLHDQAQAIASRKEPCSETR